MSWILYLRSFQLQHKSSTGLTELPRSGGSPISQDQQILAHKQHEAHPKSNPWQAKRKLWISWIAMGCSQMLPGFILVPTSSQPPKPSVIGQSEGHYDCPCNGSCLKAEQCCATRASNMCGQQVGLKPRCLTSLKATWHPGIPDNGGASLI